MFICNCFLNIKKNYLCIIYFAFKKSYSLIQNMIEYKIDCFFSMKENLPQSDHKTLAICKYYEWFRPAVDKWLDLAKLKAVQRVRRAAELDRICTGEYFVKHCTSAIDAVACFYQVLFITFYFFYLHIFIII